jgi:hypothetical protein
MKKLILSFLIVTFTGNVMLAQISWVHLSSRNGDIEPPNSGKQQTSCAVADFDNDVSAPGLDIWLQNGTGSKPGKI